MHGSIVKIDYRRFITFEVIQSKVGTRVVFLSTL